MSIADLAIGAVVLVLSLCGAYELGYRNGQSDARLFLCKPRQRQ